MVGIRHRLPLQAGHRIVLIVGVVDAALDQDTPGADRLGIFGDQRPLLGDDRPGERQHGEHKARESKFHPDLVDFLNHVKTFRIQDGCHRGTSHEIRSQTP